MINQDSQFKIQPHEAYDVTFRVVGVDVETQEFEFGTCEMCMATSQEEIVLLDLIPIINGVEFPDLAFTSSNSEYIGYGDYRFIDLGNLMTIGDRFLTKTVKVRFASTQLGELRMKLGEASVEIMNSIGDYCY